MPTDRAQDTEAIRAMFPPDGHRRSMDSCSCGVCSVCNCIARDLIKRAAADRLLIVARDQQGEPR